MAGAFTESTVIGTAGNTISRLDLSEAEKTRLLNNIPVAYAVSYLVGTGFVVWFLSSLAPRLLAGRPQGREPQARGAGGGGIRRPRAGTGRPPTASGTCAPSACPTPSPAARWPRSSGPSRPRASSCSGSAAAPRSCEAQPETVLRARRRRGRRGAAARAAGPASRRSATRSRTGSCSTSRWPRWTWWSRRSEVADRTLAEIAEEHGRGVVLLKLVRAGEEIPFEPAARSLNRGDLLRLAGRGRRRRAGRDGRSATSSGPRARPTSCSSASASCWAACSARSRCGSATCR